jgi:hypothetical protein
LANVFTNRVVLGGNRTDYLIEVKAGAAGTWAAALEVGLGDYCTGNDWLLGNKRAANRGLV